MFAPPLLQVEYRPLSTPSLGITIRVGHGTLAGPKLFQLPLSGSLVDTVLDTLNYAMVIAFNSLSRDHRALFRDFPALRGFPPRRPFAHLYFSATI